MANPCTIRTIPPVADSAYTMAEAIGVISRVLTLAVFAHKSVVKVQETINSFHSHPRLIWDKLVERGGGG
jgi:hypothetical protein